MWPFQLFTGGRNPSKADSAPPASRKCYAMTE